MVVKWTFTDPTLSETYTFDVNPREGGSPDFKKSISQMSTSAPDGLTLFFEGVDTPQVIEFSGVILDQNQYDTFVAWWDKRVLLQLTDDLDREFRVYVESFTPKRERRRSHEYYHTYTMRCIVVL